MNLVYILLSIPAIPLWRACFGFASVSDRSGECQPLRPLGAGDYDEFSVLQVCLVGDWSCAVLSIICEYLLCFGGKSLCSSWASECFAAPFPGRYSLIVFILISSVGIIFPASRRGGLLHTYSADDELSSSDQPAGSSRHSPPWGGTESRLEPSKK